MNVPTHILVFKTSTYTSRQFISCNQILQFQSSVPCNKLLTIFCRCTATFFSLQIYDRLRSYRRLLLTKGNTKAPGGSTPPPRKSVIVLSPCITSRFLIIYQSFFSDGFTTLLAKHAVQENLSEMVYSCC